MTMFKIFLLLSLLTFSLGILARESVSVDKNEISIEQKLAALKLEKRQAEMMIKKMVHTGRMSADEAVDIKREIASVKEEDVNTIRVEALERLKSTKSFANK